MNSDMQRYTVYRGIDGWVVWDYETAARGRQGHSGRDSPCGGGTQRQRATCRPMTERARERSLCCGSPMHRDKPGRWTCDRCGSTYPATASEPEK